MKMKGVICLMSDREKIIKIIRLAESFSSTYLYFDNKPLMNFFKRLNDILFHD